MAAQQQDPKQWTFTEFGELGNGLISSPAFSSDGRLFAASANNSSLIGVWDVPARKKLWEVRKQRPVRAHLQQNLVFTADNHYLISTPINDEEHGVRTCFSLISIETAQAEKHVNAPHEIPLQVCAAESIALSPNGRYLAVNLTAPLSAQNTPIIIYDTHNWDIFARIDTPYASPRNMAFHPNSRYLAVQSAWLNKKGNMNIKRFDPDLTFSAGIEIWDIVDNKILQYLNASHSQINAMVYSVDGSILYIGTLANATYRTSVLQAINPSTREIKTRYELFDHDVNHLSLGHSSSILASSSDDGIRFWSNQSAIFISYAKLMETNRDLTIGFAQFSPANSTVVVGTSNKLFISKFQEK